LLGVYIAVQFRHRMARPIQQLAQAADTFVNGEQTDVSHLQQAEALASVNHYTEESQQISMAYARMVKEIQLTLKAKDAAYEEKKIIQGRLATAEKQALIGTIAGGVAHEIKNAINPVRLRAERMLSGHLANRPLAMEEGLTLIIKNATRCAKLAIGLNDLSKTVDWTSRHDFDLNEVIRDALAESKDILDCAGVEVVSELGPLPVLKGIAKELQQAFVNFLLNSKVAIIEAQVGDKRAGYHIWITSAVKDNVIEIKLADDGCGMTEATKSRLFEPFFTTKEVGKGTGLGMGISRNILKAHGADIKIESERGKGTTVTILFPCIAHSVTETQS